LLVCKTRYCRKPVNPADDRLRTDRRRSVPGLGFPAGPELPLRQTGSRYGGLSYRTRHAASYIYQGLPGSRQRAILPAAFLQNGATPRARGVGRRFTSLTRKLRRRPAARMEDGCGPQTGRLIPNPPQTAVVKTVAYSGDLIRWTVFEEFFPDKRSPRRQVRGFIHNSRRSSRSALTQSDNTSFPSFHATGFPKPGLPPGFLEPGLPKPRFAGCPQTSDHPPT
jgi:hypothetical protein